MNLQGQANVSTQLAPSAFEMNQRAATAFWELYKVRTDIGDQIFDVKRHVYSELQRHKLEEVIAQIQEDEKETP